MVYIYIYIHIAIRHSVSAICKVQVRVDDARNQKYRTSTGVCWDGLPIHEMALRRIASSLTRRNDKNTMRNAPGECAREIRRDARKKLQLSIAWLLGDKHKAGKVKEFSVD